MTRTLPLTLALLAVCVAVFIYATTLSGPDYTQFLVRYALIPRLLLGDPISTAGYSPLPAPVTLVTSMFVHSDTGHLVLNMIVLISFGAIVERALGAWRLAAIWFVAGVAGGLLHAAIEPNSTVPVVGASGALSGVFATAFLLEPRGRIYLLFIPMPYWLGMIVFVAAHAAFIATGWSPGIAWLAHVGGLLGGFVATAVLAPRLLRAT